jgi:hypothetical protein
MSQSAFGLGSWSKSGLGGVRVKVRAYDRYNESRSGSSFG